MVDTFFCMSLSSSLRLLLAFMRCWILASEALSAFFKSTYSCMVMGPSDRSESRLCRGGGLNSRQRKNEWRQTANFPPLRISFNVSFKRAQFLNQEKLETEHLGPICLAGRKVLVRILVRRHAVVVRLVVVLAIATTSAPYVLQDEFNVICHREHHLQHVWRRRPCQKFTK